MLTSVSRRDFLRVSGIGACGVAAGLSLMEGSAQASSLFSAGGGTTTGVLLPPSSSGKVHAAFERTCQQLLNAGSLFEGGDLGHAIARLVSPRPVRLYSVTEADNWLRENGFFASLDYFVRHGGRQVAIFSELNRIGEPQYSTDPRTLAYLSHVLRETYQSRLRRRLYTLFPGPADVADLSTGTWRDGVWEYFLKYDLLAPNGGARTFGEVYRVRVDPAVADRTMLWHSGRGVFDGLAWHGEKPASADRRDLGWVRDVVDASSEVYWTEPVRMAATTAARGQSFESAGPFRLRAA